MIASCLVSMVPPFLLYLCAQKYFLQGISVQAGVKVDCFLPLTGEEFSILYISLR